MAVGDILFPSHDLNGLPLIGWVNGITVDPIFEDGTFMLDGFESQTESIVGNRISPTANGVNYYPKTYRLNFEFTVIHEHSVGWRRSEDNGEFIFRGKMGKSTQGKTFPYPSIRRLQDPIDEAGLGPLPANAESIFESEDEFNDIKQFNEISRSNANRVLSNSGGHD